jgi:hypothetical protein
VVLIAFDFAGEHDFRLSFQHGLEGRAIVAPEVGDGLEVRVQGPTGATFPPPVHTET